MAETCCSGGNGVMILACSGCSNTGQLSNQAAVELTREGFGMMFCLAGIGGKLPGFVQSVKDAPIVVVIDGCPMGCAKAILEDIHVPLKHYLVITDEGIEKNKNLQLERSDIDRVKAAVKRIADKKEPSAAPETKGVSGCGCTEC